MNDVFEHQECKGIQRIARAYQNVVPLSIVQYHEWVRVPLYSI